MKALSLISIEGLVPFRAMQKLQSQWVEQRAADHVPDTIFMLEHEPVITRGGGARPYPDHFPDPLPPGFESVSCERGGDLMVHEPGQFLIYPILKLTGSSVLAPLDDVSGYLREFEAFMIEVLDSLDVKARCKEGADGIWVGERKIASLGVAVSKWVTYHGMALNVVNDLGLFSRLSSDPLTRIKDVIPGWNAAMESNWRAEIEKRVLYFWCKRTGVKLEDTEVLRKKISELETASLPG